MEKFDFVKDDKIADVEVTWYCGNFILKKKAREIISLWRIKTL